MRFHDNPLAGLRLMSDAEREREMRQCELAYEAEKEAEAAITAAKRRKPDEAIAAARNTAVENDETAVDQDLNILIAELDAQIARTKEDAKSTASSDTPSTVDKSEADRAKVTADAAKCTHEEAVGTGLEAPPITTAVATVDGFPVLDDEQLNIEGDPFTELQNLCFDLSRHHDYQAVRARYCELSIHLNRLGKLAPAFRPKIKLPGVFNDPIYHLMNRDQLVIDMHWCHVRGFSLSPTEPEHAALFASQTSFTFAEAWVLASRKLTANYRAGEALCLTTLQQCQLFALRDTTLKEVVDRIEKGYRTSGGKMVSERARVQRAIKQWAERDRRVEEQKTAYEQLWLARELLGPGADRSQLAKLQALMAGTEPLSPSTIGQKLKKLDKALVAK